MKTTIITGAVLATLIAFALYGSNCRPHQYEMRSVHDVNGNEAFIRIDLSTGEICALGHGYAVRVDFVGDNRTGQAPVLPFCQNGGK
jgi:hypothetical protein